MPKSRLEAFNDGVIADIIDSALARAVGRDGKGVISVVAYAVAVPVSFVDVRFARAIYVAVAVLWLVPDRRIERTLTGHERTG